MAVSKQNERGQTSLQLVVIVSAPKSCLPMASSSEDDEDVPTLLVAQGISQLEQQAAQGVAPSPASPSQPPKTPVPVTLITGVQLH